MWNREQQPLRIRRASTVGAQPFQSPFQSNGSRLRAVQTPRSGGNSGQNTPWDETAPLLGEPVRQYGSPNRSNSNYGTSEARNIRSRSRRESTASSKSRFKTVYGSRENYDVNHPPSVPASPVFGAKDAGDLTFADVMMRDDLAMRSGSPNHGDDDVFSQSAMGAEDNHGRNAECRSHSPSADVCYPAPGMSELGEDETHTRDGDHRQHRSRRRRRQWPDLSTLEEWMHFEKEDRSEERRVKRITEPQLINGRLRPVRKGWYQTDEEAPYRFTYFNEEFQSTIHSQTISELVQPGSSFRELFIPDPRILSDDESDEDDDTLSIPPRAVNTNTSNIDADSRIPTRQPSAAEMRRSETTSPAPVNDGTTADSSRAPSVLGLPQGAAGPNGTPQGPAGNNGTARTGDSNLFKSPTNELTDIAEKPVRYGDRPVWWLDVFCPTEEEMKVISKAFGIHPLTAEDIMLQEAREKVELFRHYYFVNYRTFDQDVNSENFLEPVNMYVVVFREGVLSFHFSMTPHAANVRRRIRQLRDYLILSSDWISYAIIDDITDVFQPLIQNIEDEVDEIDEAILRLHTYEKGDDSRLDDNTTVADSSGDMLRRVGDCRKRVMSLYRLLGNKADVIKGFAKRCNERWEVAPRSEIGLYLGDIQDHIVTMTSNLSHYEK